MDLTVSWEMFVRRNIMKSKRRNFGYQNLLFFPYRCFIEDNSSKVAWLNRSGIIFAGQDKWSLDPRVELQKLSPLEYSLRIQKVDVYDEGSYTCSVQTLHQPKTSQVYLIVQGKEWLLEVGGTLWNKCLIHSRSVMSTFFWLPNAEN